MEVRIDGELYIPKSKVIPNGRHPSDICKRCGSEQFSTRDSRNIDGFRIRTKECLECGYRWRTIEYMYLPKGRPKNLTDFYDES